MQSLRRWNIKHWSLVISGALVFYVFVLSSGYYKYHIDGVIVKTKPERVWEYVGDFRKMQTLNPTILHFKILADHGHAHDWRYTVEYTERLSHWPFWLNVATAHYVVTKTLPGVRPEIYAIESKHETCFLKGWYCLRAESKFHFSAIGGDTYVNEKIHYQCPPLLSSACRRELEFQRRAVIHNLTQIFSNSSRD